MSLSEGERRARAAAAARALDEPVFQDAFARVETKAVEAIIAADLAAPGALERVRTLQAEVKAVRALKQALKGIVNDDTAANRAPPSIA